MPDPTGPTRWKHGFATDCVASPGPCGNRFGTAASIAANPAGGAPPSFCAGASRLYAATALSAREPSVTVCGSPFPAQSKTPDWPGLTVIVCGKYVRHDTFAFGLV